MFGHTFYSWSTFIVMETDFLLHVLSSAWISWYIFSTLFTIFRPIKSTLYSVFYPKTTSFYKTAWSPTLFTPTFQYFYTDISAISVTFCNSAAVALVSPHCLSKSVNRFLPQPSNIFTQIYLQYLWHFETLLLIKFQQ